MEISDEDGYNWLKGGVDDGVRTAYTVVKLFFCLKVDLVIQSVQIFFV